MAWEKLRILMLQRVANIGKQWEIIEVSHTQAKNYLIPKWLARLVTKKEEEDLLKNKEIKEKNTRENVYNRHKIAEILHWKEISIEVRWSGDKIFWWVGELDIISKIEKDFEIKLEKKNILLPEWHHIKKTWNYDIKLNLWSDVFARINLNIKVK